MVRPTRRVARPPGRLVALEGPSASGKTTLGRIAAARLGFEFLPEALRFGPPFSIRFASPAEFLAIERRLLEQEARRWARAERSRADGRSVLLDTVPWGPLGYTYGLARAGRVPIGLVRAVRREFDRARPAIGSPDLVVYLDVPPGERERRTHRPGPLFARHLAAARGERELWIGPWARRVPVRRLAVRPGTSVAVVARRLVRTIERPGPARRRRARRLEARALMPDRAIRSLRSRAARSTRSSGRGPPPPRYRSRRRAR